MTGPFCRALCEAMDAACMTASALATATRLAGTPVSAPTLRTWMAGTAWPSRRATVRAVETIETLLHLAPGALVALLRPIGCPTALPRGDAVLFTRLGELRREWGLPATDAVESLLVTSHLDLTDPRAGRLEHTIVGTSRRAGARRFPVVLDGIVLAAEADGATALRDALEVAGGRALRAALVPDGLAVVEVELERPHEAGDTVHVGLAAAAAPAECAATLRAVALARCVAIAAQISPPADAPAGWATPRTDALGAAADSDGQRRPSTAPTVQHVEIDMAPGIASITWEAGEPV